METLQENKELFSLDILKKGFTIPIGYLIVVIKEDGFICYDGHYSSNVQEEEIIYLYKRKRICNG